LLAQNLILELEVVQNNSLGHSIEFAKEKEEFSALINELQSNNTELEEKLKLTIDYWNFALDAEKSDHDQEVESLNEDHEREIEQIHS